MYKNLGVYGTLISLRGKVEDQSLEAIGRIFVRLKRYAREVENIQIIFDKVSQRYTITINTLGQTEPYISSGGYGRTTEEFLKRVFLDVKDACRPSWPMAHLPVIIEDMKSSYLGWGGRDDYNHFMGKYSHQAEGCEVEYPNENFIIFTL